MRPGRAPPARTAMAAPRDRAWGVVFGAFLVTMVGYGAIYSYAAFADDIAGTFGASRGAVSFVYALSGGSCFLVSALTGALADWIGARVLAALGMLLVGIGFLMAAAAQSMIEVYLGYGLLIGIGTGCAYVPAIALVQGWFRTHRGVASGLAVSGIGVGTALVPPTVAALSALGDWRSAFVACALLCIATGLVGAMLLRPLPDVSAQLRQLVPAPAVTLRSRGFGLAYAGTFLVSLPAVLPHALLVSTAQDLGLARGDALALLGLIGVGTIAGRFLLAALADQVGRTGVFLLCCAGMSASMLVWGLARDPWALVGFALGFGALQGGFVALLPAFVADRFGPLGLGGVIGALYTGRGMALLAAPPLLTLAIGMLHWHALPLLVVALLGLAGTWLLAAARWTI
jgi:OFA family oxalate/formate antiporter-like MFS transporter